MKLIRLFTLPLPVGLSCLTSCQKEDLPPADNERTLFMYLPWSTKLTSYFYQHITDMKEAIAHYSGIIPSAPSLHSKASTCPQTSWYRAMH